MNPFTPPEPEKQYVCDKCKQSPPTLFDKAIGLFFLLILCALATHGLMTLAKQYGIVDFRGEHFWFEQPLREWLRTQCGW